MRFRWYHEKELSILDRNRRLMREYGQNADGDLLYTSTRPWSDGTTGIKLSPLELLKKLAALIPLPRQHQVRYGGCLAQHTAGSHHSDAAPAGVEDSKDSTASPNWTWARLLKAGLLE